ncbi:MAG TPA: GDP-L-fucose synthase [Desulfosarcina sp.]|nr:GDP-L-fucose synthase [Desulfosarcina sp.]
MNKDDKIFIAGAAGMVGSAIVRRLLSMGYTNLLGSCHSRMPDPAVFSGVTGAQLPAGLRLVQTDLLQQAAVDRLFQTERPVHAFLAAAQVGGIHANNSYPARFIHDNLVIQSNFIHAAHQRGVDRLLFLGSSCIYPKLAPQPMQEVHLLTGLLEPTNEPYAVAKIAGIKMCEAYNRQYGTRFMAVMPTNLYGPNDNFDLQDSHVLPALIRKFHEAAARGDDAVTVWGSGTPRREFLHVDDMADACLFVMNLDDRTVAEQFLNYPTPCFVNVGVGRDVTIRELAEIVRDVVGFAGDLVFDATKPDGTPQKLLDVSRMADLGWRASIGLKEGIAQTYRWYKQRNL